jgi:energy-coupling factor transporter ATP-binding protein EcfA2
MDDALTGTRSWCAGCARRGSPQAVADLAFDVRRGEIFGVHGPHGAGKTTSVEVLKFARDDVPELVAGQGVETMLPPSPWPRPSSSSFLSGVFACEDDLSNRIRSWRCDPGLAGGFTSSDVGHVCRCTSSTGIPGTRRRIRDATEPRTSSPSLDRWRATTMRVACRSPATAARVSAAFVPSSSA